MFVLSREGRGRQRDSVLDCNKEQMIIVYFSQTIILQYMPGKQGGGEPSLLAVDSSST